MNKLPHVAVLGATGAVGQEFIRLFEERNFSFASLKLLASAKSAGKKLMVCGEEYTRTRGPRSRSSTTESI